MRCHIREDDPTSLQAGIGGMADVFTQTAAGRLPRGLEALARDVVEEAVIDAAQPAVLETAVAEVRPSMAAMQVEEPIRSAEA